LQQAKQNSVLYVLSLSNLTTTSPCSDLNLLCTSGFRSACRIMSHILLPALIDHVMSCGIGTPTYLIDTRPSYRNAPTYLISARPSLLLARAYPLAPRLSASYFHPFHLIEQQVTYATHPRDYISAHRTPTSAHGHVTLSSLHSQFHPNPPKRGQSAPQKIF